MYAPLVLTALGWLNDPVALRAFLTTLANQSDALAAAFQRVRASEVLAKALQGQAGAELKAMGQELLAGLGGPLAMAVMAAGAAAGQRR